MGDFDPIYVHIYEGVFLKGYIRAYVLYLAYYCILSLFDKTIRHGVKGRHMRDKQWQLILFFLLNLATKQVIVAWWWEPKKWLLAIFASFIMYHIHERHPNLIILMLCGLFIGSLLSHTEKRKKDSPLGCNAIFQVDHLCRTEKWRCHYQNAISNRTIFKIESYSNK